jgi:hypothetical protein
MTMPDNQHRRYRPAAPQGSLPTWVIGALAAGVAVAATLIRTIA